MTQEPHLPIKRTEPSTLTVVLQRHRFSLLFAMLILMLAAAPLIEIIGVGTFLDEIIFALFVIAVLITSVYAVSRTKLTLMIGLALAVPTAVFQLGNVALDDSYTFLTYHICALLFFGFLIVILLRFLFVSRVVTTDVIFASLCNYLFLGIFWALVYSLIVAAIPDSFAYLGSTVHDPGDLRFGGNNSAYALYYSFVTMTTLGYGDVVPISPVAATASKASGP